jgi:hypothetical protein
VFPPNLFVNLFTFFDQYNFTVYEDSPDEHTVAVDPEILGHIFENLLEDNKDKGAYYTPKEIVHYMCRESLIEYLYTKFNPQETEAYQELGKSQTDLFGNDSKKGQLALEKKHNQPKEIVKREAIEKLILHHEAADLIEYDEAILRALREVKICDPAIGSGAFPMGLLLEIFHLVETLYYASPDVTSDIWKLGKGWNPAKVKEEIIQNSIYGVDIEKGAVDIARLRFWLSLIVDENAPRALPNLDYKIVVGDSLLSKFESEIIDIDWNMHMGKAVSTNKEIIKEQELKLYQLQHSQHLYFHVKGHKSKLQLEIRDLKIDILINQFTLSRIKFEEENNVQLSLMATDKERQKREAVQEKIRDYNRMIQKLETIKKNKNTLLHFFDWKLDFPEVMNEKINKREAGFDIVIGNPPYIQMQKDGGALANELSNKGFKTFERTGDIYAIFYEKGFQLLRDSGIHTFITSSQWLRANYGKSLRNYFLSQNPKILLVLGPGIFDAVVDTNILIAQKGIYKKQLKGIVVKNRNQVESVRNSELLDMPYVSETAWSVIENNKQLLNQKLIKYGKALKTWKVKINFGIKTGYNKAFIIDEDTRTELIKFDKKNNQIIKPVIKGKEVKSYITAWENDYIIFIPWHFPNQEDNSIQGASLKAEKKFRNDYSAIYKYLDSHRDGLCQRNKAETGIRYEWYALQRCAATYLNEFSKEKVIWKRIGSQLRFSYSDKEVYCLDSTCIATGEKVKYLTALLNSKLCKYQLFEYAPRTGMGDLIISVQALEPLLLHYPTAEEKKIVSFLTEILKRKEKDLGCDVNDLEKQIDLLVYKLYDLTYDEVCIVEGNTEWMNKEEYENFEIN